MPRAVAEVYVEDARGEALAHEHRSRQAAERRPALRVLRRVHKPEAPS